MLKQTRRPIDTEKTIEELKMSIDSIEQMIKKSQQILHNTRPLQPREIRSDSIQLRFNSASKSKSKQKAPLADSMFRKLNSTDNTKDTTFVSEPRTESNIKHRPQKTKPHLFIDTDAINEERSNTHSGSNILVQDVISPISNTGQKADEYDSSSFADSLESHFNLGRRFRTETVNDSWELNTLESSLERKREEDRTGLRGQEEGFGRIRKIVLKKRVRKNHLKNLSELEEYRSKDKRRIFDAKVQPGRYSYFQQGLTKKDIQKGIESPSNNDFRVATLSSAREPCRKYQKENQQMGMEEFLKKVKKYGFVERYLSRAEICCIYEYLRKSSIPEHKWPLYVVDEVYEKMQTPKSQA